MFYSTTRPRSASIGPARAKSSGVEGADRVPRWSLEADRATICGNCWRAVERAQDQQFCHLAAITDTLVEKAAHVVDSQRCQCRVVKRFCTGNIVAAKADMREDAYFTRSS